MSTLNLRIILIISLSIVTLSCNKSKESKIFGSRPNILICIADDASFPHMGAYGTKWTNTPAFDRVADEGVLFMNAYTPNAKCAPSRACILTGRNSWQLEEAANHWAYFPSKFKTYVEALSEKGYYTGFTGKGWAPGVAGKVNGKQRQLAGKPWQQLKLAPPTNKIAKTDYFENFRAFFDAKPQQEPFCFWYGGFEPHRGYEYGSGIEKGDKKLSDIDKIFPFWPANDTIRNDMLDYAYEIEYFDKQLQKILNLLEEKGQLSNTLILVTADNGMPFPRIKGQEYEYSNHLPLAMMWKDGIQDPGRIVEELVSFIDFAPTFLEVAGVSQEKSGMQQIEGKSLSDIIMSANNTTGNKRDHILIGKERHDVGRPHDWGYPIRGIVKNKYLYIHNFEPDRWPSGNPETGYLNCDGSPTKTMILNENRNKTNTQNWKWAFGKRSPEELFNIKDDPECIHNLAEINKYQSIKEEMKLQLFNELKEQGDPRMFGKGYLFDEYPYANPHDTAFYKRYMRGENPKAGWVYKTDFEKEWNSDPE